MEEEVEEVRWSRGSGNPEEGSWVGNKRKVEEEKERRRRNQGLCEDWPGGGPTMQDLDPDDTR